VASVFNFKDGSKVIIGHGPDVVALLLSGGSGRVFALVLTADEAEQKGQELIRSAMIARELAAPKPFKVGWKDEEGPAAGAHDS